MIRPRHVPAPADVAAHYDELDWLYREVWGEHVHHGLWLAGNESPEVAVRQLVERVADRAAVGPNTEVCDVGCGYGAAARELATGRGARVTGITLSPVQHAWASARAGGAPGSLTFVLGDWLDNGFADASFDAVLAIESTEHFPDLERGLGEAWRVLRPGGRLVVATWLAHARPRNWQVHWLLEPICREGRLVALGTASEYRECILDCGFALERFEDVSAQVKRTWSVCIARSARGVLRDRRFRAFLLDRTKTQRVFAACVVRLWAAYATRAIGYGLFTARRITGGG